jgi:adenylylsulfate kinase
VFSLFFAFALFCYLFFPVMTCKDIHPIRGRQVERSQKEKLLGQKGSVFWLCGLSGSGKSTLAIDLENRLGQKGIFSIVLDGDNLRSGLNQDLGFSDDDRRENIRRTTELAKILCQSGVAVIVSCITPLQEFRDSAKENIGTGDYKEVYVKASFSECKKRDVKGLYAKAATSAVPAFTGSTSSFEEPRLPDLTIETEKESLTESSSKLYSFVMSTLSSS